MEEHPALSETFTCSICPKSFINKKSQARHISYCRRAKSRVRSRKRACGLCTKAKTRCDLAYPSCARCTAKNLTCDYEGLQLPKISVDHISNTSINEASQLTLSSTSTLGFGSPLDSLDYESWSLEPTDAISMYVEDAVPQTVIQRLQTSPRLPYLDLDRTVDFSSIGVANTLMFDQVIPKSPKMFLSKRVHNHQFSLNRNYVVSNLRSYPFMFLPGESLPPFIHEQCLTDISGNEQVVHRSLSKPLATCAAIIQMFSVKNESNTIFIWKTIRMEQERILAECSQYDDWTSVAALQAIALYFLLRLSEDNDEATNFDIPLIHTMIKLSFKVQGLFKKYVNPFENCTPTWKNWALAESLRRTIIVLFLVDLLVDYTSSLPSHECSGNLLANMALPCARDLWRAATNEKWQKEYAMRHQGKGMEKQLTYGDLLNFRFRADHTLDSWLSQLDDFGTLVMAAASLPE